MTNFLWRCPFCDHDTTILGSNYSVEHHDLTIPNADGFRSLYTQFIVCPNSKCRKFTLSVHLHELQEFKIPPYWRAVKKLENWQLIPSSEAKVFSPTIVPQVILDDYKEACLIRDLSPKASATLSRRCLQGMIRDFWKVKKKKLKQEIDAIKDKVEHKTWEAIEAVRKVGNIGAHMEKDINLIIDVEPKEAQLLIGLIEILIKDWYIAKHEREEKLTAIKKIAEDKDAKKKKRGVKKEVEKEVKIEWE